MKVILDSAVSENTVLALAEGVISSDLNGEVVILNMKNGNYYGLDEVGHRVWTLVQERQLTVKEIQDALLEEYDVDKERCKQDLLDLVEQLIREELIEVKSETGS